MPVHPSGAVAPPPGVTTPREANRKGPPSPSPARRLTRGPHLRPRWLTRRVQAPTRSGRARTCADGHTPDEGTGPSRAGRSSERLFVDDHPRRCEGHQLGIPTQPLRWPSRLANRSRRHDGRRPVDGHRHYPAGARTGTASSSDGCRRPARQARWRRSSSRSSMPASCGTRKDPAPIPHAAGGRNASTLSSPFRGAVTSTMTYTSPRDRVATCRNCMWIRRNHQEPHGLTA